MQKVLATFGLFVLCSLHVSAQNTGKTVTGTIKNENGEPLASATVRAENPVTHFSVSTSSGKDGVFRFNQLPDNGPYTFVISLIGYDNDTLANNTIPVSGTLTLDAVMSIKATSLEDVVVTGYGRSSRKNLTASITSVPAEEMNVGVLSSPAQMLQGKVAGLNITRSGNPNGRPAVLLRGPSTLRTDDGAQEPFYVIDGIPDASPDLVSPDDIASIDILKDASATAIYGARAANGIIMITTKKAKAGQVRVSYNGYIASERVSNRIDMLSGPAFRDYMTSINRTLLPRYDDGSNTDWQKEVQRDGFSHSHNISFSGGSATSTFAASINYLENQGVMKGSALEKITARLSVETRALNDRLKLGLNFLNNTDNKDNIPSQVFGSMISYVPTVGVKNAAGNYNEDVAISWYNPVAYIDNNLDKTKDRKTLISGFAELKIFPFLKYTLSLAAQNHQENRNLYFNSISMLAPGANGVAKRSTYENNKKVLESYFNFDKGFGRHYVQALAGYSWQEDRRGDGFGVRTQNFTTDDLTYNNLYFSNPPAGTVIFDNTGINTLRLISFYGRVNYQFDDKYLFQASLRRDGSSAFGMNNRWGYFPAFSAGWRISKESFMDNVAFIDDLKLRAGYGATGNSLGFPALISVYRYDRTGTFYLNGAMANAFGIVQNNNPNLKWEKTATSNIGIDVSFLKGRLTAAMDYYIKSTSDLISVYTVSSTQFVEDQLVANVGKIRNNGFEFAVNATPVQTKSFTWKSSFNISTNKNKVVSLSNDVLAVNEFLTAFVGGKGQSGIPKQVLREGYPIGTFNTWHYAGKDQAGLSTFLFADGSVKAAQPTIADHMILGNAQPKFIYGWNNNFNYRNFDLNIFVRGVSGNKILNATLASLNSPAVTSNPPSNIPQFTVDQGDQVADLYTNLLSDRFIESGSYLRLDNATLGYSLPLKSQYIRKLRMYASVNNAFVITNYRGIDPEINMGGIEPGIDNNNFYPRTRSFIFGVNVIF
jgi:TonB-dependent starch-binding outer membrane protein SusC